MSVLIACFLGLIIGYILADATEAAILQHKANRFRKECDMPTKSLVSAAVSRWK